MTRLTDKQRRLAINEITVDLKRDADEVEKWTDDEMIDFLNEELGLYWNDLFGWTERPTLPFEQRTYWL